MKKQGIGSHQSHNSITTEWLTPPEIIQALGPFDYDPCPASVQAPGYQGMDCPPPYPATDSLITEWPKDKRIWLNPPYSSKIEPWLKKLADHGNGTALIFARTETAAFCRQVWDRAFALLFIAGRLHFYHNDGTKAKGNSGAPSVLITYSEHDAQMLRQSGIDGYYVQNWDYNTLPSNQIRMEV